MITIEKNAIVFSQTKDKNWVLHPHDNLSGLEIWRRETGIELEKRSKELRKKKRRDSTFFKRKYIEKRTKVRYTGPGCEKKNKMPKIQARVCLANDKVILATETEIVHVPFALKCTGWYFFLNVIFCLFRNVVLTSTYKFILLSTTL